jgi:hypothetical protein
MITRAEAVKMIERLCSTSTRQERMMLGGILWHFDRNHSVEKIMKGEKYAALPTKLKAAVNYVLASIDEN